MLIQQKWKCLLQYKSLRGATALLRTPCKYGDKSRNTSHPLRTLQLSAARGTNAGSLDSQKNAPMDAEEMLIYRWPTMRHFRFISKFKVYQVSLMLALLPPVVHWYSVDKLSATALGYGGVALMGTASVLAIVSHYFSKLVGELHFDPRHEKVRISTLTFWGNRREEEFPADDIVMFVESQTRMGGAFQKLEFRGHKKVYMWSIQYGRVLNLDCLRKVLRISDIDLSHF